MKLEDFSSLVQDSNILTKEEIVSVINCLGSVTSFPVGFIKTKRGGYQFDGDVQQCCRFGSSSASGWNYSGCDVDAISFTVNKDVVLHGVCLFGSENNTYSVKLDVMDSNSKSIVVSKSERFPLELLQGKNCNYYGFRVMFDKKKIHLKKNTKYDIRAKISEPPSMRGENGVSSVRCSGATFTFMNSKYSTNGTSIDEGQYPELLFSL